ncbi:Retrovirus-related Pol polyprotein from transposon RE1 [Vitis vinifera]|uniref:Retrovirus-related Pol polyprotein from transposon RE1 n=1 Tax=Vitis vinifera TaxID=29760 RepID=A0A438FI28_VITVI|nr:Retrovirus-related Pol polyprotein from transposon RE1 [Vitis vinifera]
MPHSEHDKEHHQFSSQTKKTKEEEPTAKMYEQPKKLIETSSRIVSKTRICTVHNEHTWGVSSLAKLAWLQVLCLFLKISQLAAPFSSTSPLVLHPSCPVWRITLLYTLSLKPKNDQESPYSLYGRPESLSLLDIKNVFLHGDLAEEVYMEQPPGFIAQGSLEFDMFRNTANHSIFYHHNSLGQCIYLVVYVDDIVITGSDQNDIQKLKQHIFTHFQTKDLGKLKYFLEIEIAQSSSGVVLSQRKYALDMLEETGMLDCKPVDTPMDPNVKLIPGQGEPLGDLGDIGDL